MKKDVRGLNDMKISFDFDSTLDNEHMQKFAVKLMNMGFDIHIVTSRPSKIWKKTIWDNSDLFQIAEILNIKRENIHFTENSPKYIFFQKNEEFILHLDDFHIEVDEINEHTKVKGVLFEEGWEQNCLNIISNPIEF